MVTVQPEEELMRSAPQRYDTVCAALRYTGDGSTIRAVRERFLRSEATHPSIWSALCQP